MDGRRIKTGARFESAPAGARFEIGSQAAIFDTVGIEKNAFSNRCRATRNGIAL